ncbi:protein of unknown function (plasmid) [Cupriavidus neocaledonicus]|uniref:Uncharacterized protein n=1 Tax=Cupriavidus neocaledonicus TaxID=1040979 RepID=A0A375HRW8_9BURK|nr:hypothetical protein CBM2605_B110157 [Cupriavidus neocaledonicus]SPD59726.1 protein of unknown function [Cupriavidus neocaledonicus]
MVRPQQRGPGAARGACAGRAGDLAIGPVRRRRGPAALCLFYLRLFGAFGSEAG